uniref:Uncharacterized protein n=1 Tax=viral metagenome TaxID=1070528 RepID=A0A6C0AE61_9ZZZZ
MKTVYLYQTSGNFKYEREYLCLTTKQDSDFYIGEIEIPENVDKISFAHTISDESNIFFTDKDTFLNDNLIKCKISINEYYKKNYGDNKKDIEIIDVQIFNVINRLNDCIIHYIEPLKYCCISKQETFYNYIENIQVEDRIITTKELERRMLLGIPESVEMKTMCMEISTDVTYSFRGLNMNKSIKELYFPIWNIGINYHSNTQKILFNVEKRYKRSNSKNTVHLQKEAYEIKSEIIFGDKLNKIYKTILSFSMCENSKNDIQNFIIDSLKDESI